MLLLQSKVHELGSFAYTYIYRCAVCWVCAYGTRSRDGEHIKSQLTLMLLRRSKAKTFPSNIFCSSSDFICLSIWCCWCCCRCHCYSFVRCVNDVMLILLIELYEPNYTVVKCTALCNITPFLLVVIDAYVCVCVRIVSIMAVPLRTPFKISTIR